MYGFVLLPRGLLYYGSPKNIPTRNKLGTNCQLKLPSPHHDLSLLVSINNLYLAAYTHMAALSF